MVGTVSWAMCSKGQQVGISASAVGQQAPGTRSLADRHRSKCFLREDSDCTSIRSAVQCWVRPYIHGKCTCTGACMHAAFALYGQFGVDVYIMWHMAYGIPAYRVPPSLAVMYSTFRACKLCHSRGALYLKCACALPKPAT